MDKMYCHWLKKPIYQLEGLVLLYLKKVMDLLWSRFIRDLVGGSNRLLGYKNKSGAKFC